MDSTVLDDLSAVVAFMRENGVLHYRQGDLELTLHASALEPPTGDFDFGEMDVATTPASYASDYDNPMLYPDGKDPIQDQRDRLKQQDEKTLIGLNQ
jgi:hypothetical protein